MPGGRKLNHRRERAIAALLNCPTIDSAARTAGISSRTLRNWLADPGFAAEYRRARAAVRDETICWLVRAGTQAVATLVAGLAAARVADRLRAADLILSHGADGLFTTDVLARLQALEEAAARGALGPAPPRRPCAPGGNGHGTVIG
jgi:hypothetical protein